MQYRHTENISKDKNKTKYETHFVVNDNSN